jgi:hypothetical protein
LFFGLFLANRVVDGAGANDILLAQELNILFLGFFGAACYGRVGKNIP